MFSRNYLDPGHHKRLVQLCPCQFGFYLSLCRSARVTIAFRIWICCSTNKPTPCRWCRLCKSMLKCSASCFYSTYITFSCQYYIRHTQNTGFVLCFSYFVKFPAYYYGQFSSQNEFYICGQKLDLQISSSLTMKTVHFYELPFNTLCFSFSPAGWDNEKKIAILHENLSTVRPEDPFEDFITKPPVRKVRQG